MSRSFKINTHSHDLVSSERVSWLDQFADNLDKASKTAVEVARQRQQPSIYDQISSVMNGPYNHGKTVEGVVKEMQERIGLEDYLKRVSEKTENRKIAQQNQVFARFEQDLRENILNFIKNTVSTHHGLISVPAVQYEVLSNFRSSGVRADDVNDELVAKHISDTILEYQRTYPHASKLTNDIGKNVGLNEDDSDNQMLMSLKD